MDRKELINKVISQRLDSMIITRLDNLIDIYHEVYKARRSGTYNYWAKVLNAEIEDNVPIVTDTLKQVYANYIDQIEGRIRKSFFIFKATVDVDFDAVRPTYESGLYQVYIKSGMAGAREFASKIGIATTFSPVDTYAIDYYRYLVNMRTDFLIDTDKKLLANILRSGNAEGLGLKQIKKRMVEYLSDTPKIAARAHNIATTETSVSLNWAKFESGLATKVKMLKTWFTTGDKRVRLSHSILDGVTIPANEYFVTGLGNACNYPADAMLSAPDIVGCRCTFSMYPA